MAVDKLVDSTQLDSDLTSVANAIRSKGGTSAQLAFPSGFVGAIGNIPTGGEPKFDIQNALGTWLSEIPDLSGLDRTGQVLYMVVDTSQADTELYSVVGLRVVQTATYERGHLSNGSFVVDDTQTATAGQYWYDTLNKNGERFWIYRITSSDNIVRIDTYAPSTLAQTYNGYTTIVAFYGNLPYLNQPNCFAYSVNYNLLSFDVKNILTVPGITIISHDVKLSGITISTTMQNMFYTNPFIEEVDLSDWNIDSVTTMKGMFMGVKTIKRVRFGEHQTSSLTNINSLFSGARALDHIDISGLDLSNVTDTTSAFYEMTNLINIDGWTAIPISYGFTSSQNISHDSLMKVINSLPTVQTTQTLTLGQYNSARLSAEEIAIATAKGWTVA